MKQLRNAVIRAGLEAMAVTGVHHLLQPLVQGVGFILMLHNVRPARSAAFQPNQHLEITPEFLRATLAHLRAADIDIVTMDEVQRRLAEKDFRRRFVAFTYDDGYRDNRDHALPVMRAFDAPLAVYVTTDFADGKGRLWWLALEAIVAKSDRIDVRIGGEHIIAETTTSDTKQAAYARIHEALRHMPNDHDLLAAVQTLASRHDVDITSFSRDLCMTWDELRDFARDPLVTIGAHTVTHCNVAHERPDDARVQLSSSSERIMRELGRPVRHFAFPYGDRCAAGPRDFQIAGQQFATAVTTRPGVLFAEHADHLAALPRVSLNGQYQSKRFLPVLTSGSATAFANGFRRLDVD